MKTLMFIIFVTVMFVSCKEEAVTPTPPTTSKVAVSTSKLTITPNGSVVFRASVKDLLDTTVAWRVEPSTGGTITNTGVNTIIFKAGSTDGVVKVIAKANGDATQEATITITISVTPPAVKKLFDNGNIAGVQNNPRNPTTFTADKAYTVVYVNTYHYFNNGVLPGTIAFQHEDGTMYGPWLTVGTLGQGGVSNAYWVCYPYVTIKAGKYTVIDSNPATWSHNSQSGYTGFTYINVLAE